MTSIVDKANQIIDLYCEAMNVPRQSLSKLQYKKLARVDKNGTSLAFIRQSLAHLLYKRLPLNAAELGKLIGYSDHSMVSLYSRIVENHIEIQDPYFMPYYQKLAEIAEPIVSEVNFERISAYYWRSVDKKVQKIRSIRDFSV